MPVNENMNTDQFIPPYFLKVLEGGLGKREEGAIPCRTEYGEVWTIGDHVLIISTRRPKFLSSRVDATYIVSENKTVEEWQAELQTKRKKGDVIEDHSKKNNGNLWLACILEGVLYRGYTTSCETADLLLSRAEMMLFPEKAYRES
jgi:hypothetical protein